MVFARYLALVMLVGTSLLSSSTCTTSSVDSDTEVQDDENDGIFHPTHEWQVVREGQSIPAGLHVRIDMQTGLKEAKLMDGDLPADRGTFGDPRRPHYYGRSDRRGIINKSSRIFTRDQLSEMLDNLNEESSSQVPLLSASSFSSSSSSSSSANKPQTATSSESSQPLHHLPSLKDVKDQLSVHSEVQVMMELLQVLVGEEETPEKLLTALEELEYHVHQIDNARDLDTIGGLQLLVLLLNHSSSDVAAATANVIGSAAQSNPQVQAQLLKYGALSSLLPLMSSSQPEILQRRAIFALGAILRDHVLAINRFIHINGLQLVSTGVEQRSTVVVSKLSLLIADLLSVKEESQSIEVKDSGSLAQQVSQLGWCTHCMTLISADKTAIQEKGLHLMKLLTGHCDFSGHSKRLQQLHADLNQEGVEPDLKELLDDIILATQDKHRTEL